MVNDYLNWFFNIFQFGFPQFEKFYNRQQFFIVNLVIAFREIHFVKKSKRQVSIGHYHRIEKKNSAVI